MKTIKNIFLTDDDQDDCLLFAETLNALYHDNAPRLIVANDGEVLFDVLDIYIPPPPEVLFLDINMPKKDGIHCLRDIRNTPKYKDIPIVMFSTTADKYIIDKTYELGANYYATKPNSYSKMKTCLSHILSFGAAKLSTFPLRENFVIPAE